MIQTCSGNKGKEKEIFRKSKKTKSRKSSSRKDLAKGSQRRKTRKKVQNKIITMKIVFKNSFITQNIFMFVIIILS